MDFIHRTPFFRFIIPFVIGIISYQYVDIFSWGLVTLFTLSFLCILVSFLIKDGKLQYKFRWLFGSGIFLFFFVAAYFVANMNESRSVFQNLNKQGVVEAEILEQPVEKEKSYLCRIKTINWFEHSKSIPHHSKALVYIQKDSLSARLQSGDILLLRIIFREPDGAVNPNGFDYKTYLRRQGIGASVYLDAGSWRKIGANTDFSIVRLAEKCQLKLLAVYKQYGIKGDEFAVLAALTLGSKDALHPELRQNYTTSGGMHILAVSGLHVGVIYMVLSFVFSFVFRKPRLRWYKAVLIVLCLWMYAFITGLPPSVIRSTIMFTMIAIGVGIGRKSLIYNTIFTSAFLMLLYNPNFLFDVGFQLSYVAVLSIVYFQPQIAKWFCFKNKIFRWMWELTAVSLAAQIGTAGFMLYYFHQFANYFILTNFVAIPLATFIIYGATLLFSVASIPVLASFVAYFLNWLLLILNFCIQFIHDLPYAVTFTSINFLQIILLIGIVVLMAIYVESRKYVLILSSAFLLLLFISINVWASICTCSDSQIVVYSDNQDTHVDFINGNKHYVYSTDYNSLQKVANNFWIANKFDDPDLLEVQNFYYAGFVDFAGKKICILNAETLKNKTSTIKVNVDYLILGNKLKPNIQQILENIQPRKIIVDKSISKWYTNKISEACKSRNLQFYSVAEKGAFVLKLKD